MTVTDDPHARPSPAPGASPAPGSSSAAGDDRSPEALDDREDRDELRSRYYGLMQELRVLLPGVQVLVAFLLTAPFAQRFADVDGFGRSTFAFSLVTGLLAVVAFMAPTAFHRLGDRRARSTRLRTGIVLTRVGFAFLGLSLLSALTVVTRFVFGSPTAAVLVGLVAAAMVTAWIVVPLRTRGPQSPSA